MSEQELVRLCMVEICKRSGYDANQHLAQRDLEQLSAHIEEKTDVLISLSTLKRLLNGQFTRMPQVATLNAISAFLGYDNWQAFKTAHKKEVQAVESEPQPEPAPRPQARRKIPVLAVAVVIVLGVVGIFAYKSLSHHNTAADYERTLFSARKTTSHDLPNTVVFSYNIDELEGDSFFIQQSWDDNRRKRIYKNNYTLTDIYYEPGYHKAKLIVNDKAVKTFDVSIPTQGWFVFVHKPVVRSVPVYITNSPVINNGMLAIAAKDLATYGIDSLQEHIYCYTYFPGLQKVSSDNFHFKARVRMNNVAKLACPRLMCEVYTQRTFIFFRATSPGCTANTDAMFGEDFLSGQNNDLSGLGCDVTQWQDMEIVVKNRRAAVLINGKEVLSHSYKTSSGGIAGIGFVSNGLVEVDAVDLKALDGTPVYSSEF